MVFIGTEPLKVLWSQSFTGVLHVFEPNFYPVNIIKNQLNLAHMAGLVTKMIWCDNSSSKWFISPSTGKRLISRREKSLWSVLMLVLCMIMIMITHKHHGFSYKSPKRKRNFWRRGQCRVLLGFQDHLTSRWWRILVCSGPDHSQSGDAAGLSGPLFIHTWLI